MSIELQRNAAQAVLAPPIGPKTDKDDETADESTSTPVPSPTRASALRDMFQTRTKWWIFWSAFGLWTVSLSLSSSTTYLYLAFATSYFGSNPKLSTIGLLTAILGGVTQPFWGRLADLSRRTISLILALALYTVGYAISTGSKSVEALAAGQVIYSIGNTGLGFVQTLIVADLTSLQYRGLVFGLMSFTFVPFAFVAPNIASGIGLENWRWGYGMFCIIMPVCLAPVIALLLLGERRVRNPTPGPRMDSKRFSHTLHLVDPVGLILVGFAFVLLLAPATLYVSAKGGWRNPSMIAMEVSGGVIFVLCLIWEWKFAAHPFFPLRIFSFNYSLCLLTATSLFLFTGIYNTFWSSWTWVVQDYTQRQWSYLNQTNGVALSVFSLIAGIALRFIKRYKYIQFAGLVMCTIGTGVNYYSATHPTTATLVMSQLLIQGGSGAALLAAQTAAQASVRHDDLAISIAMWIFVLQMSNAIGSAIAGSVWSHDLVENLVTYAPSLNATDILSVAGDITVARVMEPRDGIMQAYSQTYRRLALGTIVVIVVPTLTSLFCRDYVLDERQNAAEEQMDEEEQ